jgi:hypothetical protein
LDGKVYASFKARYEDKIVQQMIINDGAGKLSLNTLKNWYCSFSSKKVCFLDFKAWEGVEAQTVCRIERI